MALKDWKKIHAEEDVIINWKNIKKDELYVGIEKINKNKFIFYSEDAYKGRFYYKIFKTKSQALKFAKQYMKTH